MSILLLLLPVTLLLSLSAVVAFAWAARGGQFDDLRTPALRVLHDAAPSEPEAKTAEVALAQRPAGATSAIPPLSAGKQRRAVPRPVSR